MREIACVCYKVVVQKRSQKLCYATQEEQLAFMTGIHTHQGFLEGGARISPPPPKFRTVL